MKKLTTESRIAVCSRSFSRNPILRKELLSRFPRSRFNDAGVSLGKGSLVDFLSGHDGAIVALEDITASVLSQLPNLQVIGKYGVGLNNIDLQACLDHSVEIGWRGGVNALAVAELAMTMMLSLVRLVPESQDMARRGEWKQVVGRQLSGKTVGIVGMGNVGKLLINLLTPFNVNCLAHDLVFDDDFASANRVVKVDFETLLRDSDLISLHIPLTDKTTELISKREIQKMKQGAILVNTARGGIVNEASALAALEDGRLGGLGFDVLSEEPPLDVGWFSNPRVMVTSHIGGSSDDAILKMGRAAIDGLLNHKRADLISS